MKFVQESLFHSAIRSLFTTFFGIIGLGIGIIAIFAGIAFITPAENIIMSTKPSVLPSADGQRYALDSKSPIILNIDIQGVIGTESLNASSIRNQLIDSREGPFSKDRVKAIFLSINSGGGAAFESDKIYRLIKEYKEKYHVPVYAHVDGICASGAMYAACSADKIYANEVSIVGSVGTIMQPFFNFHQLLDKVGVDSKTISSGKDKDLMNPFRPWGENEGSSFQNISDHLYHVFVDVVAASRKNISKDQLINKYGANIFPASEAKQYGFIDGDNYNRDQALQALVEATDIKENQKYIVVNLRSRNLIADIFESKLPWSDKTVTHKIQLSPEIDSNLMGQYLFMYCPGQ
ncbi:MAG: S49 family peptidase [Chlamydiota bacterium]